MNKVNIAQVDAQLPVFETSWTEHLAEHKQFIADREEALNRAETALAKLQ